MNAAFLVAEEEAVVEIRHLLLAAQSEYSKLERPLTDNGVKGWISSNNNIASLNSQLLQLKMRDNSRL